MKSAYELAMERLQKQSPVTKITAEQKAELARLDTLYKAKNRQGASTGRRQFRGRTPAATQPRPPPHRGRIGGQKGEGAGGEVGMAVQIVMDHDLSRTKHSSPSFGHIPDLVLFLLWGDW